MTEDAVRFYGNDKVNWKWLDSNYINFVFLYDPSEDKISHVRLCDKLVLNHEIISKGNTKDTLLPIDSEDFYRPASFYLEVNADNIVEHYRRLTGNGKITLDWVVNDIVKTCYCFNKDVKSSVQILSRWAQGKKAPRIFYEPNSLPLKKKADDLLKAFHCLKKIKDNRETLALWRALKKIKKAADALKAFHCLEKIKDNKNYRETLALWRALKEIKKAADANRLKNNPLLNKPE